MNGRNGIMDRVAAFRARFSGRGAMRRPGMTLVEVLVAMAILAVVSVMCVSAFMTVLGAEMRETNTRLASEDAEVRIAEGGAPSSTGAAVISLGDFYLPSFAYSYDETVGTDAAIATENGSIDTSGRRSYTVLKGAPGGSGGSGEPEQIPQAILFGDGAAAFTGKAGIFAADPGTQGNTMSYKVLQDGRYRLEVWGAKGGGNGGGNGKDLGGNGGYAVGTVNLTKGDTLYLYAGGVGSYGRTVPGGYNGGGQSANYVGTGSGAEANIFVGSGGGASDIRINGDTLNNRVIVAGGGGGAGTRSGNNITTTAGGSGGGETGKPGTDSGTEGGYPVNDKYVGQGGTQTAGGATGTSGSTAGDNGRDTVNGPGTFGQGGFTTATGLNGVGVTGGGGGGGWYGGGAGSYSSGGGGSGWVFTEGAYTTWKNAGGGTDYAFNPTDNQNFLLQNATLVDGKGGAGQMPNPLDTNFDPTNPEKAGETMTGNARGGFIRIIYLEAE